MVWLNLILIFLGVLNLTLGLMAIMPLFNSFNVAVGVACFAALIWKP